MVTVGTKELLAMHHIEDSLHTYSKVLDSYIGKPLVDKKPSLGIE